VEIKKPFILILSLFAPRDYYQTLQKIFEDLLKKVGVPSINELFEKAKGERRLWIYHTGKSMS